MYINFPKKGVVQTFLRGPRINVWTTPFFGKLKGKNWRGKRVEERMRKCLLQNSKLKMQNAMWKKENSKGTLDHHHFFYLRSTSLSSIYISNHSKNRFLFYFCPSFFVEHGHELMFVHHLFRKIEEGKISGLKEGEGRNWKGKRVEEKKNAFG